MLKKKIMGLSVAAFSMIAIVGSGFSAWFFDQDTRGAVDAFTGIDVVHANGFGAISTTYSYRLQLDQVDADDDAGKTGAAYGISVMEKGANATDFTAATSIQATWTVPTQTYEESSPAYYVNIYLSNTIEKYVKIADTTFKTGNDIVGAASANYATGYTRYQAAISLPENAANKGQDTTTVALSLATRFGTDSGSNLFQYYSDTEAEDNTDLAIVAKPDTFAEYQAMVFALKGAESAGDVTIDKDYRIDGSLVAVEFQVVNKNRS